MICVSASVGVGGVGVDGAGYSNERVPLVTRLLMQRSLKCSTRPVLHPSASGLVKLKHWPGTKKHLKELEFNIKRLGKIAKETESWDDLTRGTRSVAVNQEINRNAPCRGMIKSGSISMSLDVYFK